MENGLLIFVLKSPTLTRVKYNNSCLFLGKSKDGKVPVKYGRYQRNILTLKQVLMQTVVYVILALRVPIMTAFHMNNRTARTFLFASNLVVVNFLFEILIPICILYNLYINIPSFFKKESRVSPTTSFYVRQPPIIPRRNNPIVNPNPKNIINRPMVHNSILVENERKEDPIIPTIKLNGKIMSKTTYTTKNAS